MGACRPLRLTTSSDGVPLPLTTVTSSAPTAHVAAKLATSTVSVLQGDITQQQNASGTPADQRVQLQTIKSGSPATLVKGPSKTIPILVLFAIVSASIALAFIRNNHSEDPVRTTRRRLDEGLVPDDGGAFANDGNGRLVEPEYGRVLTGSGSTRLLGLLRAGSGPRLAEEENGGPQHAATEEPSATHGRRTWSDRQPHFLRASDLERETRD